MRFVEVCMPSGMRRGSIRDMTMFADADMRFQTAKFRELLFTQVIRYGYIKLLQHVHPDSANCSASQWVRT